MSTPNRPVVELYGERLWRSLMELAEIGAYDDPATGLRGVNRPTLSDADVVARTTLMGWMKAAGLAVRVDRIGNIYGRRAGAQDSAAPVIMGSHIDTVPTAGAFDGPLGVLGALEVIRSLNERGIATQRPVELACFTEEEGSRFGTDMLGSAVAAGRIPLEEAHALTDREGLTLGAELERTGFLGTADERLTPPHAYLECHIEQGPLMADRQWDIGVVTGTQGISWQEVSITGRAGHAGATPTDLRADAGLAAARVIAHLRTMAQSGSFGELRATVGRLRLDPDAINIIPAQAVFTVDLRNPDDAMMAQAEGDLDAFLQELAAHTLGIEVSTKRMARTRSVAFDERVRELIAEVADGLGLANGAIMSGAGHDAQEMAAICPTGMVFVPGEYDGVSHTPREYSTPEACVAGITVLADSLVRLANQG